MNPLEVIKPHLKILRHSILDIRDTLLGLRDEMVPPRRKIFIGGGDYKKIGEEFFGYFVSLGGLKPSDHVLDIGCGQGRMALPLINFLDKGGCYEGIDIVEEGINWCKKKITSRHPNFNFQKADVFNKLYNPKGTFCAREYKLPFPDDMFDFAFLTSVFTHMFPGDIENYSAEIGRVLKPGASCLITFFLWNDEASNLLMAGESSQPFHHLLEDGCRTVNPARPEDAIAIDEIWVRSLFPKVGLVINKIAYGSWPGRAEHLSYQDLVIATNVGAGQKC